MRERQDMFLSTVSSFNANRFLLSKKPKTNTPFNTNPNPFLLSIPKTKNPIPIQSPTLKARHKLPNQFNSQLTDRTTPVLRAKLKSRFPTSTPFKPIQFNPILKPKQKSTFPTTLKEKKKKETKYEDIRSKLPRYSEIED